MLKFVYALFFSLLWVGAANSQDGGRTVDGCLKIASDLDRLSCYDAASGRTPKNEVIVSKGSWNASTETSKMTDQTSVFLSVKSDETINCGWNKGDKISLQLRCKENSTDLLFITNCHMSSGSYSSYGDIEYRVDSEKSRKVDGTASTDNRALGLWGGGKSIPVIKQMIGRQKIVVRMTPYSESPFTATFDISGLEESIKPLRKECGW